MRSTTVLSFFAASLALLSQSPIAYAAPILSLVDLAAAKRGCDLGDCRIEIGSDINTNTTSQSPTMQLAQVLLGALQQYLNGPSPSSDNTSTIELASSPEDTGSDDSTTLDNNLSTDAAALASESL